MRNRALLLVLLALPAPAATRVLVTVVEQKSGRPVRDLKAGDFSVLDDRVPRRVELAEHSSGPIDAMLLLDTSLAGGAVLPVAGNLIGQLQDKEQMAVVAFDSSATLIQDFTSSRELLSRAVAGVKFGNSPRVLDALYAAMDGGFQGTVSRRVIVLLSTGYEGPSRTGEREVFRLARRNQVSIYPVYMTGVGRSLFESLARQTGGASFNLRDMKRASEDAPGARIFEVLRAHYILTLSGNLALSERMKIEVRRPEKLLVSALTLE
ncbi:MAG: VWA domain-containing protein [Acidobacteria bacterium]|nr:VWA domain-containing protein [Acidobacteriota bacterium]